MNPFRDWLAGHMKDATAEFKRLQAEEDQIGDNRDLYERVHQMWGYLAGLEKCLNEFDALEGKKPKLKAKPSAKTQAKKTSAAKKKR